MAITRLRRQKQTSKRSASRSGNEKPRRRATLSKSLTTTDPKVIRQWVEARGGHPATVVGTGKRNQPGLLRIDYPGYRGQQKLKPISWDDFFDKFEESDLAFVYQVKTATGRESRFSKLVSRESASKKKAA